MREVCPTCDFGRCDRRHWYVFHFLDARRVGHGYEPTREAAMAAFARANRLDQDDVNVLEDGVMVGRIFLSPGALQDRPWASGHNGDIRRAAHGYEPTREDAIAAFAKSWAKAVGSRTQNLTRVTRVTPDCWGHSLSSAFAKSWRRGRTAGIGGQRGCSLIESSG
jgi:hypothetical protein